MLFVSFSVGLSVLTGCVAFGRIDKDAGEDVGAEAEDGGVTLLWPEAGAGTDAAATLLLWLAPAGDAALSVFSGALPDEPGVPEIGWLAGTVLSSDFGR
jgi:hypothetical protein